VSGGRDKLVFVNSGFTGGNIERVINEVSRSVRNSGKQIEVLSQEEELLTICRNSIRGTSTCIGAAVFFSSPDEGPAGKWNYTIRADGALESKIVTDSNTNDVEIYALPLQHAIDFAIAGLNDSVDTASFPTEVLEYSYTSLTKQQRQTKIRIRYMSGIIDILAVAFLIGMVGITYQLTGLIATEREIGMAQLLDCMMPNRARWQPQMARIISNHLAFDLLYGPGWIVMAIILSVGVFSKTSSGIMIVFHILAGLSMSSMSILGGAFFHKAQLSGITSVIVSLLLGIVAQVAGKASTGAVAILSLLFPPMNYVYFTILLARWEEQDMGTNLVKSAPGSPWKLPGIVLWVFLIIQILVFPVLGATVERTLYGTASKSRTVAHSSESLNAVTIHGLTKEYRLGWFAKTFGPLFGSRKQNVVAVKDLTLNAVKGQIMVLLGANGSGKSTTLDAIAGLTEITSGAIELCYPGRSNGFGFCPQKNVLWDDLTVQEHVRIFNRIKCTDHIDNKGQIHQLLSDCDIDHKMTARSKTLSGGQKRKLQLAVMFTGGSSVCCVDEVSSGLDPISRRKIWDILLAERAKRSIIFTTHFLDEADLLSDHIAILSKGSLRAEGTAVELKHNLGSGYRVHVYNLPGKSTPDYEGVRREQLYDQTIYSLADSAEAAKFVARLERDGIQEYQVNGPTIEDVFLKVAEEVMVDSPEAARSESPEDHDKQIVEVDIKENPIEPDRGCAPQLMAGKRIGMASQAWALFGKRAIVLRRNYLPFAAALLIPIVAAGLVTLFLKNFQKAGCSPTGSISVSDISSLTSQISFDLVVGPPSKLSPSALERFAGTLRGGGGADSGAANLTGLLQSLHLVDTLEDFHNYITANFSSVTPGGFFIGEGSPPAGTTFAWRGNADISFATIIQNALDVLLTNVSISSQYQAFDQPWGASVGSALQLITYFGLAMSVYPAFFALYPTIERLRNVRALHYSNGVRSLPLWLAYASFDFIIVLLASVVAVAIFAGSSSVWYHIEYLFVVFFLYGLASTLLSYVISLLSRSQLAAFAFAAAGQAVMFLLYFIAYMSILTYSPIDRIDTDVNIAHFTIALISPIANLTRSLFISLNVFSLTCRDRAFASYPGAMTVYGGPILYLVMQSLFLMGLLLLWDSGLLAGGLRAKFRRKDVEEKHSVEDEVSNELTRVESSQDGLRVLHLTKQFKDNLAVDDVTFGVPRGEVFALLGPNGAGKSTTISLIRGDIKPSGHGGEVLVENVSVAKHRAQARSHLGVCPQFDAMDTMTVYEHLKFYARIRGVEDPRHNAQEVMRAVGLESYAGRMAAKLSGGNKRKLSLGIALMGNPTVLLLDEPSSGMDAASKRVMWRTLASVVPGRSLVLTTQ
jgi:ATP-binding cassette, subfamily A (ABC1), member 3